MILPDANVLVYALNEDAAEHHDSRAVVDAALDGTLPGALVPQVLIEAYAVLTDARRIGTPLEPEVAWQEMNTLRAGLRTFDLTPQVLDILTGIIASRRPSGQDIFDALLVAQMRAHGIDILCTYNVDDFRGYPGLTVESPRQTLARTGLK